MLHSVVRPAVASVVALAILSRPLLPTACADVCSIFSPFAGQFALESQAVVAHTIKRVWVGGFVINLFRVDASWALPQASTPAHARTRTSAHISWCACTCIAMGMGDWGGGAAEDKLRGVRWWA